MKDIQRKSNKFCARPVSPLVTLIRCSSNLVVELDAPMGQMRLECPMMVSSGEDSHEALRISFLSQ